MATRWRLDTCDCEFIFENEDADNLESYKFLKKCNIHANDTTMTVIEENRGKNRAVAKLMEAGLEPHKIGFEFEKKGAGRRLCKLTIPSGTEIPEVDNIDKDHTRILLEFHPGVK